MWHAVCSSLSFIYTVCTLLLFNYVESLVYDRQTLLDIRSSYMDVFEAKIGNLADNTQKLVSYVIFRIFPERVNTANHHLLSKAPASCSTLTKNDADKRSLSG